MNRVIKHRSHEQFAQLLELSPPSAVDPDLASMASLASALRAAGQTAGPVAPDPAFRAALRQRLVAVATVQAAEPAVAEPRAGSTSRLSYRAQRRIAALASSVALVTSMAGVGVAASRSLPGDPFYGVKRATEGVQLWLAQGDVAKGKRHLEFARTRLAEARALPSDSSHITSTLAAMDAQTTAGAAELIAAYKSSHSTAPLATLVTFSRQQTKDLVQLAKRLPGDVRDDDLASIGVVTGIVKQVHTVAKGVCVMCTPNGGGSRKGGSGPSPHPSGHPSQQPTSGPRNSPSAHPSTGPSQKPTHRGSALPKPSHSLPITIPTTVLPTKVLHSKDPTPLLSTLLGEVGH